MICLMWVGIENCFTNGVAVGASTYARPKARWRWRSYTNDNIEQFRSRDSLQLSIGFYEPQKHNEAKAAASKQYGWKLNGKRESWASDTILGQWNSFKWRCNGVLWKPNQTWEREREEEENNLLELIHRENQVATSCIYSIQIRNAFPPL